MKYIKQIRFIWEHECIYPQHLDDDIVVTYKLKDTKHFGHQFRSGKVHLLAKAQRHMKQSYNKESYWYADILVYGHFHHFTMIEDRILIGAPALDGGSKWIEQTHGKLTKAGILTFCIDTFA